MRPVRISILAPSPRPVNSNEAGWEWLQYPATAAEPGLAEIVRQARGEYLVLLAGTAPSTTLVDRAIKTLQGTASGCVVLCAGLKEGRTSVTTLFGHLFCDWDRLITGVVIICRRTDFDCQRVGEVQHQHCIRRLCVPWLLAAKLVGQEVWVEPWTGAAAASPPDPVLAQEAMALFDAGRASGMLREIRWYAQAVRQLYNWVNEAVRQATQTSAANIVLQQRSRELAAILDKFSRMRSAFNELAEYSCPLCEHKVMQFQPMSQAYLADLAQHGYRYPLQEHETFNVSQYYCPVCHATDYERIYALYLRSMSPVRQRLLHVGPSQTLRQFITELGWFEQRTADLYLTNVDDQLDVADMKTYTDGQFDCFICSMVLEHVNNDHAALSELYRVIRHGGWGILMVPIVLTLKQVDEEAEPLHASERWHRFGHDTHVRAYSRDGFLERVRAAGFIVSELRQSDFGADLWRTCGIAANSVLYRVEKSQS